MKKKFIVLSTVILIVVVLLSFLLFRRNDEKIKPIRTVGIVEATEINLSSKVSGRIVEICCREGDIVNAGAVVIKIESDDLKASVEQAIASVERARADAKSAAAMVESSKAELNTAEAEVKNAEAEVEKTKVQMDEAKRQMERITALFKEELVSKAEEDRAVTSFESLRAAYAASKARHRAMLSRMELASSQFNYSLSQLASAKARIKESEAALAYHRVRLNDTIITTPITGTVIFKAIESGEIVSPGVIILTVVDLNNLWVRVDIEETLISRIKLGDKAVITVEGIPNRVFKGSVKEIGRYGEFATQKDVTGGRQDIKTFRAKVHLEGKDVILKPGMTVLVEIP